MQHPDSPPSTPTSDADHRSLTDLWRALSGADAACPTADFHLRPAAHKAYTEAATAFHQRFDALTTWPATTQDPAAEGLAR